MRELIKAGEMVFWHPQGRDDTEPYPAIVLHVDSGEMLRVMTFNPETGAAKVQQNVWEIGSRPIKDNPNIALARGCWSHRHPEPKITAVLDTQPKAEQPPFDPTPKKQAVKKEEPALT